MQQRYQPNSPYSIATGEMTAKENIVWAASGGVTPAWTNTFSKKGVYRFSNDEWTNFTNEVIPALDSLYDIITVAVDPKDNTAWAGSFGGGLLHFTTDKTVQVLKQAFAIGALIQQPE